MKLFKLYITLADYKSRWEIAKLINRGFSDEIDFLTKELAKHKRTRNKQGQFTSKKVNMTEALRKEKLAREFEGVPTYNTLKEAVKMEGFGS